MVAGVTIASRFWLENGCRSYNSPRFLAPGASGVRLAPIRPISSDINEGFYLEVLRVEMYPMIRG
jgi:hypothetical protein